MDHDKLISTAGIGLVLCFMSGIWAAVMVLFSFIFDMLKLAWLTQTLLMLAKVLGLCAALMLVFTFVVMSMAVVLEMIDEQK